MENQFINKQFLEDYLNKIAQRVDWLVTTCSGIHTKPIAKEEARNHLNSTIKEILQELYEVGFVAGKKEADYEHDQRYRVNKYKLENKIRGELKKEILNQVMKEYGIKDEKIKKKLVKKVISDEVDVEANN